MTVLSRNIFLCLISTFFASALLHSFLPLVSSFDAFRWFQISVIILSFLLFLRQNLTSFSTLSIIAFLLVFSLENIPYPIVFMFFDLGYWVSVFCVAFYLVTTGVRHDELAKWTAVAAGIGGILYLPTILMGLVFWYIQGGGRASDFLPFGFYGIRPWSHLASWIMPLIMGALAMSSALPLFRHRFWKNLLIITAAFWFVVLLGSGARGSLIAQLLSILTLFAFFGKKAFPIGKLWLIALGWGVGLYVLLILFLPSFIFSATEDYSVLRFGASGRLELWGYALELSARYFPFGTGPLSYVSETPVMGLGTPHSLYFRWAAEYGWLFVAVFLGGFLWAGRPLWLNFRKSSAEATDSFRLAIFWSVLSAFTHASVSGVFTSPYSLLVGLPILIGYLVYVLKARFSADSFAVKLPKVRGIAAVFFGISVAMVPSMHDWYEGARIDQKRYMEEYHQSLSPRFWLHGRYIGEEFKGQEITP